MLKAKKGFILRKLGREYMIVAIGKASEQFNGMVRTNETGSFYWKEIEKGITKEELLAKSMVRFSGVEESVLKQDIEEFIASIPFAIEVE